MTRIRVVPPMRLTTSIWSMETKLGEGDAIKDRCDQFLVGVTGEL